MYGVVDPLSVAAVTGVLGAVSAGMANEAGKWAWESVGGLVRRIAGREVPAPAGAAEREAVARLLVAGAQQDPVQARALASWMSGNGAGGRFAVEIPRLLPASVRFFTDRQGPLVLLDREATRKADGRPRLVVLHGPEGIGTSALAAHWGAREARRFPDGQLYADLRGGGSPGTAPDPAAVLRQFLRGLGVPKEHLPPALEDRIDLYRTLLGSRRLLVVLDHAQSAAQVRPLVTGAPGVFTVVVARRPLTGLDAVEVPVGPLSDKDARRLLADVAGRQTVSAARAGLPSLLERCGGSPFALRAAAPYLTSAVPGAAGAGPGEVAGVGRPEHGGDPVRAVAEDLYRRLAPGLARFYRLCALRPWPAIGPVLAAAATGLDERDAARLLAELAELRLIETTPAGRYRYRPAVRRHAEEAAAREDGLAACAASVDATVGRLVRFAVQADFAALKQRWHIGPLYDELGPGPYQDEGRALAALADELGNLAEAVRAAEDFDRPDRVCELVEALWAFQLKVGRQEDLLPALRAGARAQARYPDQRMAGRMHGQLALALMELHAHPEAEEHLLAAADAEERAGHARGRATAVESLGLLRLRQWRFQEAYDCFERADRLLDRIGPEDDGAADLPRARALLERHRGRALRGLGRFDRARERLSTALLFFRGSGESFNSARILTDLAEIRLDEGRPEDALALVDEAGAALARESAEIHLGYLAALRGRCVSAAG
ncbi:tetratricopeptide repeat protein [Kitasatospora sp. NPDC050543]|uniref:tetratricopeptide repeat protein n=1 Tax=Kitasatospora sp. NPDC050543 TaxID=3364054 RepID=UPI003790920B